MIKTKYKKSHAISICISGYSAKLEVFIIDNELKKCAQSALGSWIERSIISNLNIIICKDSVTSFKHYTLLNIQSKCMEEWDRWTEWVRDPLGGLGEGEGGGDSGKYAEIYGK